MELNSYDEIIQMKYLPQGEIVIGVKDRPENDVGEKIRIISANVAYRRFRGLFAFGVKSPYSFKPIDEPDSIRDKTFKVIMKNRKNWDTLIECLDSSLNYDYKTVYYLLHYLRDKRPNPVPKDELVNYLHDMGCKKNDMSPDTIYEDIKK